MSALVSYVQANGPDGIEDDLGIRVRQHPAYPHLYQFTYSQTDSPKSNRVVMESRGTILDSSKAWEPVARPFVRFFNYGEGPAANINWKTAKVQTKMDGSLAIVWYYAGQWHISTRGSPDASGQVGDNPFTFAELCWGTLKDLGFEEPREDQQHLTFLFELCTKYNRVVVRHPDPKIVLLGVRGSVSGVEHPVDDFSDQYDVVQTHGLQSVDEITTTFQDLDPLEHEGYVIVDGNFNRIKVKHPGYVAIHHLTEATGKKRFVQLAISAEDSEFLTYFPEHQKEYDEVEGRLQDLLDDLEQAWDECKDIEDQKEFALALQSRRLRAMGVLFTKRKLEQQGESMTIRELVSKTSIRSLMKTLGYKD